MSEPISKIVRSWVAVYLSILSFPALSLSNCDPLTGAGSTLQIPLKKSFQFPSSQEVPQPLEDCSITLKFYDPVTGFAYDQAQSAAIGMVASTMMKWLTKSQQTSFLRSETIGTNYVKNAYPRIAARLAESSTISGFAKDIVTPQGAATAIGVYAVKEYLKDAAKVKCNGDDNACYVMAISVLDITASTAGATLGGGGKYPLLFGIVLSQTSNTVDHLKELYDAHEELGEENRVALISAVSSYAVSAKVEANYRSRARTVLGTTGNTPRNRSEVNAKSTIDWMTTSVFPSLNDGLFDFGDYSDLGNLGQWGIKLRKSYLDYKKLGNINYVKGMATAYANYVESLDKKYKLPAGVLLVQMFNSTELNEIKRIEPRLVTIICNC